MFKSPLERSFIDITTSVTNLIIFVEISCLVACINLDWLSRHQFGLHFKSSNWRFTSIKRSQSIIKVFCDSDRFQCACSSVSRTSVVDLRQMNWSNCINSMEVIFCSNLNRLISNLASHYVLSIFSPFVSLKASFDVWIDQSYIIAWLFDVIASFKRHSIHQRRKSFFTIINIRRKSVLYV